MKKYIVASTILGIFILLYLVFPYYSVYKLFLSLKEGDRYKLESCINFDSVRSSLKEQINAKMMEELVNDKELQDNPFAGLAVMLVPKLVDYMLDAYLTPSGIATLIRKGKLENKIDELQESAPSTTEVNEDIDFWHVLSLAEYAFFTNPSTFLIEIEDVKFKFKLQEWAWKLSGIYLPSEAIVDRSNAKINPIAVLLGKKPSSEGKLHGIDRYISGKPDEKGNKRLSFKDLNGSFVNSKKAGKLFVVKGLVTNMYPDKRSFIRIRSNILDSKGKAVKSKIVYAGNPISDKELLSLSMEEVDNRLRDKFGKNKMNTNIPPNSSIPLMIVFGNLPQDLSEFEVEAISSSSTKLPNIGEQNKEGPLSTCWIKAGAANVRSGPSTNNLIILTLKQGDKVHLINQLGKWCKVKLGKKKENVGWIHSSLLSNDTTFLHQLAKVKEEAGELESALLLYKEILDISPGDEEAEKAYLRLKLELLHK